MKNSQSKKRIVNLNRVFFNNVLIFLFIFLLPSQLGRHFFFDFSFIFGVRVDYLTPTLYMTDLLAALLFILNAQTLIRTINRKILVLFFFGGLMNVAFSVSPFVSLYASLKLLEIYFVFILFRKLTTKSQTILWAFLVGAIIQLILALAQVLTGHAIQGFFYFLGERSFSLTTPGIAKALWQMKEVLRPYGTFSHPNSLAGFYLLVYLYILTYRRFERYRFARPVVLLLCSFLVLLSFSKAAIVAFVLLNLIFLLRRREAIGCKLCVIARAVGLLVCCSLFFFFVSDPLSLEKRIVLLKQALILISSHPFFGVGLRAYTVAQSVFPSRYVGFINQPVHNIFLLFLTETGLVGLGLLTYVLRGVRNIIVTYPYIFGAIALTGFFDHYWLTLQQNLLVGGVILGILAKKR